jgi:TonB family protein
LRSRKHPFARFIATMHRGIHELWAYGFLEQLDTRSGSHPLNDHSLWTRLEVVLNGDGTIDSVKVVHHSGNASFDAAAREIIYAAGPYPEPPPEIRSGNGKIYVHWAFHRDERACGTFGAQPFILDNAGNGDVPNPHAEIAIGAGGGGGGHAGHSHGPAPEGRRLGRNDGESSGGGGARVSQGQAGGGEGPTRAGGGGSRANGGSGSGGSGGGSGGGGGGSAGAGGSPGGVGLSPRVGPPRPPAAPSPEREEGAGDGIDPAAKETATAFLRALSSGKVPNMVTRSAVPFSTGATVAARSAEELESLLGSLAEEADGATARVEGVFSAAQLRKRFGSVPAGIEEGDGRLYALAKVGGDTIVLVLDKRFSRWKVTGIAR